MLVPLLPHAFPRADFELGTFTTFERRVLYEALDVTALVRPGPNALGVMLGHGWWSQPSVKAGPRQLIALLSVTTADGTTTYYPSTLAAGATKAGAAAVVPLVFSATAGPVLADDIYEGETFSGPVAAALGGWAQPGYAPGPGVAWVPAVAPVVSPATYGSVVSAHPLPIRTDRTFAVAPGGISQPGPGVYVFDFGQNMAGAWEVWEVWEVGFSAGLRRCRFAHFSRYRYRRRRVQARRR